MGPKRKGGGKKNVPSQQPAPTNQSASASASAVATPAQGRPPPRDRDSTGSDRLPSPPRESVRLAGLSNTELLDDEMDVVAKQIEDGEKLQHFFGEAVSATQHWRYSHAERDSQYTPSPTIDYRTMPRNN